MGKFLLAVMLVVAVELILMVWIGRAISYRDRMSRAHPPPALGPVARPDAGGPAAARRQAS